MIHPGHHFCHFSGVDRNRCCAAIAKPDER